MRWLPIQAFNRVIDAVAKGNVAQIVSFLVILGVVGGTVYLFRKRL